MTSVTEEMIEVAWTAWDKASGYSKPERLRAALEAALSASPAAQTEVEKCAGCGQPPFAYPCQMQGCPHQWPGTDAPSAPQPTEPVAVTEAKAKLSAVWAVLEDYRRRHDPHNGDCEVCGLIRRTDAALLDVLSPERKDKSNG